MFDQLFESFRKASESSLQMQQDLFRQWTQQWTSAPPGSAGVPVEWGRSFQKRWGELAVESLNRHRESLDASYKSAIQVVEQALRASEAKSSEDYGRTVEGLLKKLFDTFRDQSEAQFREFRGWAEKSFEMVQKADLH